jgi:hypothetical protein
VQEGGLARTADASINKSKAWQRTESARTARPTRLDRRTVRRPGVTVRSPPTSSAPRAALVAVKLAALRTGKRAYRRRAVTPCDACVEIELGVGKLRIRGALAQQLLDRLLELSTR